MELENNTQLETGKENTQVIVESEQNETPAQSTEKTFTQKELNEIIKSRLDRERKKFPSDEDLKSFKDWKLSQQSEQEKYQELNNKYEELKKEYITYKNYNLVKNENVNEMFIDFVIDKVSKQDGDFEENLKLFKEKNPQFFDINKFIKMSTSPRMENVEEKTKKKELKNFF